jgi:hypothetical protein
VIIILSCDVSLLHAAGNGYLKSSYEGENCIEVVYIELSARWVLSRTARYLIWTEAPQLLACSTRFKGALPLRTEVNYQLFICTYVYFTKPSIYNVCDTPSKMSVD